MVLRTAAAGIVMLCFYGRRKEAERAQELAVILEKWLKRIYDDPAWNLEGSYNNVGQHSKRKAAARTLVLGQALASGFRALGICQARWANLTYETSTRADLQVKSISNLRIAVGPGLGNEDNIEVLYSLAMVYFQTRDIDSAMRVIKKALSIGVVDLGEEGGPNEGVESTSFLDTQKRRLLLKSWHLLALLLSAREKFSAAVTSCDAALELFRIRSKSPGQSQARRLIGNIDSCDMKSIIEVRMTQLALAEVVDGPEEAVNASQDLLGLYSRLFNYSEQPRSKPAVSASTSPPASRHETIRSFRGSFLGRSKDARIKSSGSGSAQRNLGSGSFVSQESPNAIARTPAISVTTVNTSSTKKGPHHSHHLFHHEPKKLHKRNNRSSEGSIKAPASSGFFQPPSGLPVQNPQNGMSQSIKPDELPPNESIDYTSEDVGVAISHDEPTSSPQSSAKQRTPPALSLPQLSPPHQQSCSSQSSPKTPTSPFQNKTTLSPSLPLLMHPSPPIPLFSSSDQKRQSLTLLIKIWLHIASLYRRASMPADASGALSEAQTHITSIEASVAATNASVEAFTTPGWGGMKSVSELWADALAEQARLHEMQGHRVEAEADYEKALTNCPDHPGAIVGLSNLLLDFYESPSPSPSSPPSQDPLTIPTTPLLASLPSPPPSSTLRSLPSPSSSPSSPSQSDLLPRLCARDRAYGLLSSLTKSGAGWDCAEAWFAFARALELGGQIAKAKKALWWVVELEENRPVRGWECLAF